MIRISTDADVAAEDMAMTTEEVGGVTAIAATGVI
jgi:hypothetical protein